MGFPMSDFPMPSGDRPDAGADDFRTTTTQTMQIELSKAHDAMRRFCDSVNSSGPLPLDADYLRRQLQFAMSSMMELYILVRLLRHTGHAISAADLVADADQANAKASRRDASNGKKGGA